MRAYILSFDFWIQLLVFDGRTDSTVSPKVSFLLSSLQKCRTNKTSAEPFNDKFTVLIE